MRGCRGQGDVGGRRAMRGWEARRGLFHASRAARPTTAAYISSMASGAGGPGCAMAWLWSG